MPKKKISNKNKRRSRSVDARKLRKTGDLPTTLRKLDDSVIRYSD
jgi:hypothetical protein